MEIYEFGDKTSNIVLLQPIDGHSLDSMEHELELIGEGIKLTTFVVDDWNKDLSPWKALAVFGKEDFGDGAKKTLDEMLRYCQDSSKAYYVGGYSLAGLFSLWSVYQTDVFKGVAAVSPSIWFPGFIDYMKDNEIKCESIYLSLGNKEEKARNPVMATVGDCIRQAEKMLRDRHKNSILEWNEGNHFKDPDIRTARGFAWNLSNL